MTPKELKKLRKAVVAEHITSKDLALYHKAVQAYLKIEDSGLVEAVKRIIRESKNSLKGYGEISGSGAEKELKRVAEILEKALSTLEEKK